MGLRGPLLFKSPLLSYCILSYHGRQLSFGGLFFSEEEKERVRSKGKGGARGTVGIGEEGTVVGMHSMKE